MNGAYERSSYGHGFLKSFISAMIREGIQHEAVANEEFVFEFLDDRLAELGPASPMDVAKRIAMAIITERNEVFTAADVGSERDAASLVFMPAGKSNGRQSITFRQDKGGLRQLDFGERAAPAERIGPGDRNLLEAEQPKEPVPPTNV